MSTHLAMPRIGHLEQVIHIFGYLKEHPKRKLAFDPSHPVIDEQRFKKYDWQDFYKDVKDAIPGDMPAPRGNYMSTHCFVDADTWPATSRLAGVRQECYYFVTEH